MSRYFIEVAYKGAQYAGFQVQENANTVQAEIEKAMQTYFRQRFALTGSSRTDSGVHALQNFFHFDFEDLVADWKKVQYHLNAILPPDIVVKGIVAVGPEAHCRFDARSRTYEYALYQFKNPFLADRSYYYPYQLDLGVLNEAATLLREYEDFESFSKRNTQVKTFRCRIYESEWLAKGDQIIYRVSGNRFLRGMVRGLVGTMLKVGRGRTSIAQFREIVTSKDPSLVDFSVDAQGLTLVSVNF